MSDASTGFWSALGAVVGGVAGAAAGHYAEQYRPRARYANASGWRGHPARPSGGGSRRSKGDTAEDAMVVGGAVGAVVGAFIGGALAGNPAPPALPPTGK